MFMQKCKVSQHCANIFLLKCIPVLYCIRSDVQHSFRDIIYTLQALKMILNNQMVVLIIYHLHPQKTHGQLFRRDPMDQQISIKLGRATQMGLVILMVNMFSSLLKVTCICLLTIDFERGRKTLDIGKCDSLFGGSGWSQNCLLFFLPSTLSI